MATLVALFALTAVVYSAVGFGGGSTYIALLAVCGMDYRVIPVVALVCNLVVVCGSLVHFARAGLLDVRRAAPLVLASAPLAWMGGRMPISASVYFAMLGVTLVAAAVFMLVQVRLKQRLIWRCGSGIACAAGGGIGLLSGLVGIGGGIFLAPLLHITRWAEPKTIAATCALFIAVNSLCGLAGQLHKWQVLDAAHDVSMLLWLAPVVFVASQIGAAGSIRHLRPAVLRSATALLVLIVGVRLITTSTPGAGTVL